MKMLLVLLCVVQLGFLAKLAVRVEMFDDEACTVNPGLPAAYYYGQCFPRYKGDYDQWSYDADKNKINHAYNCQDDACTKNCREESLDLGVCYSMGKGGYIKISYEAPMKTDTQWYSDNFLNTERQCNNTDVLFVRFISDDECDNTAPGASNKVFCNTYGQLKQNVYKAKDCSGEYETHDAANDCMHFESVDVYMQKSCYTL